MNVPALRFSEFEGDWESNKIKEITQVLSGGTPSRNKKEYWEGTIPWISTAQIDFNLIEATNEYITEEGLRNSSAKLFPAMTILIAMYGQGKTRGKTSILSIEASTNQACCALLPSQKFESFFLYYYLCSQYKNLRKLSNDGGQKNLSSNLIKNITVPIPPQIREQQKIANFLTTVDKKITQLTQKKALLEDYKKGCMQQLFSQQIRFKDDEGNDYPDWDLIAFGELFSSKPTKKYQIKSKDIALTGNTPVVDQGQELIAGYSDNSKECFSHDGVLVYGDHTTIIKFIDFDFFVGADGTKVLEAKKDSIQYLYYSLSFHNIKSEGYKRHFSILKKLFLPIPCIEEQQEIANFLSTLDKKIDDVQQQIEHTKQFKKGLLQQMFV